MDEAWKPVQSSPALRHHLTHSPHSTDSLTRVIVRRVSSFNISGGSPMPGRGHCKSQSTSLSHSFSLHLVYRSVGRRQRGRTLTPSPAITHFLQDGTLLGTTHCLLVLSSHIYIGHSQNSRFGVLGQQEMTLSLRYYQKRQLWAPFTSCAWRRSLQTISRLFLL